MMTSSTRNKKRKGSLAQKCKVSSIAMLAFLLVFSENFIHEYVCLIYPNFLPFTFSSPPPPAPVSPPHFPPNCVCSFFRGPVVSVSCLVHKCGYKTIYRNMSSFSWVTSLNETDSFPQQPSIAHSCSDRGRISLASLSPLLGF